MSGSGCGCKSKNPRPHRDEEAEWIPCSFEDTGILNKKFFPRVQIHPLSLAADETRKVNTLSDAAQAMHIHVLGGVLSMWFSDYWSGDITEQVHMTWSTGNNEIIKLPPGEHRLVFFGDDDAAVTATVTIMDVEAHRD